MFVEAFNLRPETRNVTCMTAYLKIHFVPNSKHVPCQLQDPKLHTPRRSTQTVPRLSLLSEWHKVLWHTSACPFI